MATGLTTTATATSAAAITGGSEESKAIPALPAAAAVAVTTTATTVAAAASNNTIITTATTNNIGSSSFADNQYFYEDEVFRIDKKGRIKFGLVLENSGSFSSDDEDYMDDILYKGEIRVAWHPDGKEEVLNERAVGLADRTLMPGDVVRRLVPGKDTQRGYCREINMRADVKVIGTKYVVKNVMAERLRPLVIMPRDNAVCLDSWVGSTKCVKEKVVLKSSCGAIIEVNDLDLCQLKDTNTKLRNGLFADTVFYPGQTVSGRIESFDSYKLLTPTLTLKTNKKGKPIARKFVVQSVQIEGVWVQWQCEALSEDNCCDQKSGASQQPKTYVTGDDLKRLKRLNLFESCMLQINDKNYLKITNCDVIVKKSQWEKEQAVKYKLLWSQQQKDQKDDNQQQQTTTTTRNAKGITKIDKIKIKLSTTTTTNSNSTTGTGTTVVVTNQQQENEKKTLKVSSKHNITRLENHNVINNKERNETERKMFVEDDKCIKNNDFGNDEKIIVVDNTTTTTTTAGTDDWQTEEDEDEDDNDEDNSLAESTTTTVSTCSSPTPRSSPKRSPLLHKKQVKRFKKTITGGSVKKLPEIGDEVVTEALIVYSTATVVWQDGTVETGIPSTQLYPIHHLDDHEFFPGDFVLSGTANTDVSYRDYGVVQTVDHQGRTAHVKWFTTYTSADEPKPTFVGESEISVYDLKDHPDFQYRPGTIVIRIANFIGEDATCTAGQIIDNYTDGRVKVWWVDGHISMCWPQDLFEVGQYDPDNNFFRNTDSENDSWETESEISEPGGTSQKLLVPEPKISINLERARVAIARLEEIFTINPNLQNHEVMRKLLGVYKTCRYLDRLMNTTFFHEDHFMGLIERVRKGGNQSKAERAQDQKNRLFNQQSTTTIMSSSSSPNPKGTNNSINSNIDNIIESATKEYTATKIFCSSTPCKTALKKKSSKGDILSSNQQQQQQQKDSDSIVSNSNLMVTSSTTTTTTTKCSLILENESNNLVVDSKNYIEGYENHLLSCVMSNIEKATLETEDLKKFNAIHNKNNENETTNNKTVTASINNTNTNINDNDNDNSGDIMNNEESINENDSGNYSRNNEHYNCDGSCSSSSSYINRSSNDHDLHHKNNLSSTNPYPPSSLQLKLNDLKSTISSSSNIGLTDDTPELVCAKLCALLKTQLVKALQEIQEKYCKDNLNLSDFIDEYNTTTIIDYPFDEELPIDDEECEIVGDYEINNSSSVTRDESMINISSETQQNSVAVVEEKNNSDNIIPSIQTQTTITAAAATTTTTTTTMTTTSIGAGIQAVPSECFQVMENAPGSHKFLLALFHPVNVQQYYKAVRREHKLLRTSLPPGVWVRVFEDRMDLISVMIEGPKNTPYEDGMFFFDMQLGREYPKTPPLCHYISYCADRLNPNLYEDGKVCVSLLGTWSGKDTEIWGTNSTLLQVIVSIQGLILCSEPYFNEAGYEKQKGTQQGKENSRMYNEMVIIKLIQSMTKLLSSPPEIFRDEIIRHFKKNGKSMYDRIKGWMEMSQNSIIQDNNCTTTNLATTNTTTTTTTTTTSNDKKISNKYKNIQPPEFPLVPASRGFCLTSTGLLDSFYNKIEIIKNE